MSNYQAVTPKVGDKAGAPDPTKQDSQPGSDRPPLFASYTEMVNTVGAGPSASATDADVVPTDPRQADATH
jgi:hypothetical protein